MTEFIPPRPVRTFHHRGRIALGLAGALPLEADCRGARLRTPTGGKAHPEAGNRGGRMQQRKGGRTDPSRWFQNKIGPKRFDSFTWAGANNLRDHLKAHRSGREISRYDVRPGKRS